MQFIIPYFDLVVITTGYKQWLLGMKVYSSDRAFMLVKLLYHGVQSVIPQLDAAGMQAGQNPWPLWVETEPFHARRFRFKLCKHFLAVDSAT